MTRSVRYQPTAITSIDEAAVNARLHNGLTSRSGSRIAGSGSRLPTASMPLRNGR